MTEKNIQLYVCLYMVVPSYIPAYHVNEKEVENYLSADDYRHSSDFHSH